MRKRASFLLLCCLLVLDGCSKKKSTDQLIADLKSSRERDRIIAARLLQERKADAPRVVPALIEALQDREKDVRLSAIIGLGYFGDKAHDAIPALEEARNDKDRRIRDAAGIALSRIDPARFPATEQGAGK